MTPEQITFKILTDPRFAKLLEEFVWGKVERHDFLIRLEMIKEGISMPEPGLEVTEVDAHEDFLGSA